MQERFPDPSSGLPVVREKAQLRKSLVYFLTLSGKHFDRQSNREDCLWKYSYKKNQEILRCKKLRKK